MIRIYAYVNEFPIGYLGTFRLHITLNNFQIIRKVHKSLRWSQQEAESVWIRRLDEIFCWALPWESSDEKINKYPIWNFCRNPLVFLYSCIKVFIWTTFLKVFYCFNILKSKVQENIWSFWHSKKLWSER
jgi:hypothetical protein